MSDSESRQEDAAEEMVHEDCTVTMTAMEYENLQSDVYWAKQDQVNSAANARGTKVTNAVDRAVKVREFNVMMRGVVDTDEILRLVKIKFGISKSTFYEDLSGRY